MFTREHLANTDSTNAELLRRAAVAPVHGIAISADVQSAGRGQRGRRWYAEPGDALLLSVGWHFAQNARLDGLSLAVGVAVAKAAQSFATDRITLKWPNDLLLEDQQKLGGILIETMSTSSDERVAVIGIGINIRPPRAENFRHLSTAPTALAPGALLSNMHAGLADGAGIVRDALLQSILSELVSLLPEFERNGFAAFRDDWWQRRAYANAVINVVTANTHAASQLSGQIADVENNGALVINDGRALHTLHSGEVSIRIS
jgi:BirA family transcriptional regulator, biotin operon repressor / biotin---[acetyl-CoA-carboxylase] ligase